MVRTPLLLIAAALAGHTTTTVTQAADTLCSIPPSSYTDAKTDYPELKSALKTVEENSIATWYSDRISTKDAVAALATLLDTCSKSTRLSIVVYGLPNKDCSAGYSNGDGTVETSDDYVDFVTQLANAIGDRKVLYVLEPDAVGLIADGGCAVESGYKDNLLLAIPILAANANAQIYLDVGFWTLTKTDSTTAVVNIVKELGKAGRLKGITLNTSNYQLTSEIAKLCSTFQSAIGDTSMHCIVDTSRNYEVAGANSSEWCNRKSAGIGKLPTEETGYDNLDYFVWIKTPGDSDGTCDEADRSSDAMQGPAAGKFFKNHFIKLWNQGYFVQEKKMSTLDDPLATGSKSGAVAMTAHSSLVSAALVVGAALYSCFM
ncbi:Glycoside hydrolase family 6 protein [Globisporangium polare]